MRTASCLLVLSLVAVALARIVVKRETKPLPSVTDDGDSTASPRIYSLAVSSRIESRFATTLVTSRLVNAGKKAKEASFVVTLPADAFISNFSMEIDGKVTVGEVKEKEKAKATYERAKSRGQSAGHVVQRPRETNTFRIAVNVAARSKVTFSLTYQEVLKRVHGCYKHVLNVDPGQIVDDLRVDIYLAEKNRLAFVRVPEFGEKTGEKSNAELMKLPASKDVEVNQSSSGNFSVVHATYKPTVQQQKNWKTKGREGVKAQMVFLYDVERDESAGEMMTVNGYFVQFFAPEGLLTKAKHVVFVLDTSGSMMGRKMEQTKSAMGVILRDLNPEDTFNILTFSNEVHYYRENGSLAVSNSTVDSANEFVQGLVANGGTNINAALVAALNLLSSADGSATKTVIILTDGQPTVGVQGKDDIVRNALEANNKGTSIHSIGFGRGADFDLIKTISSKNGGVARKIYEDADADLQLKGFYEEVGNPLLTGLDVTYLNATADPETIVRDAANTYFRGGEVVVVGRIANYEGRQKKADNVGELTAVIKGRGASGKLSYTRSCVILPPCVCITEENCPCRPFPYPHLPWPATEQERPPLPAHSMGGFVERMWAYKTIKRLLGKGKYEVDDKEEKEALKKRALELSLKYNFVTELTSMVVVRKDADESEKKTPTSLTNDERAEGPLAQPFAASMGRTAGRHAFPSLASSYQDSFDRGSLVAQNGRVVFAPPRPTTTTTTTTTSKSSPRRRCSGPHELEAPCREVVDSHTNATHNRLKYGLDAAKAPANCTAADEETTCGCVHGYLRLPNLAGCQVLQGGGPKGEFEHLADACERACEPSCADRQSAGCLSLACADGYAYVCDNGYVRSPTGPCILPAGCPPT